MEYGVDLEAARRALTAATSRVGGILPGEDGQPDFVVYFASFGASSLDFQVHAWCEAGDYLAVQERIRTEIYVELGNEGIGIPFPQMDLHIDPAVLARAS